MYHLDGIFAARSPVNALACIVDLSSTSRCYYTISLAFAKHSAGTSKLPRAIPTKREQHYYG